MAESGPTPRMGVHRWTADSDSPSRDEFDLSFANIESLAARWEMGTKAARPAAGVERRFYLSSDTGEFYYDDGAQWWSVGAVLDNVLIKPELDSYPILKTQTDSTHYADTNHYEAEGDDGFTLAQITPGGAFQTVAPSSMFGGSLDTSTILDNATVYIEPGTSGDAGLAIRGKPSQAGELAGFFDSGGNLLSSVRSDGTVQTAKVWIRVGSPASGSDYLAYGANESSPVGGIDGPSGTPRGALTGLLGELSTSTAATGTHATDVNEATAIQITVAVPRTTTKVKVSAQWFAVTGSTGALPEFRIYRGSTLIKRVRGSKLSTGTGNESGGGIWAYDTPSVAGNVTYSLRMGVPNYSDSGSLLFTDTANGNSISVEVAR